MNAETAPVAADLCTKPMGLSHKPYIHYRHLLLLLSPKADSHLPSHGG